MLLIGTSGWQYRDWRGSFYPEKLRPRAGRRPLHGAAGGLGDKLGPLLLQLPPTFRADVGRLRDAPAAFPPDVRLAVEFRHGSWHTDEVLELLAGRDAALVMADRKGEAMWVQRTASWGFVRLHEGCADPPPCYGAKDLRRWADIIGSTWDADDDVFLFFNNDPRGCAVRNAVPGRTEMNVTA